MRKSTLSRRPTFPQRDGARTFAWLLSSFGSCSGVHGLAASVAPPASESAPLEEPPLDDDPELEPVDPDDDELDEAPSVARTSCVDAPEHAAKSVIPTARQAKWSVECTFTQRLSGMRFSRTPKPSIAGGFGQARVRFGACVDPSRRLRLVP